MARCRRNQILKRFSEEVRQDDRIYRMQNPKQRRFIRRGAILFILSENPRLLQSRSVAAKQPYGFGEAFPFLFAQN
jgi:hypothetical protein